MREVEYKMNIVNKIEHLRSLVEKLQKCRDIEEKTKFLLTIPSVFQKINRNQNAELSKNDPYLVFIYLSLVALEQDGPVTDISTLAPLCKVDAFFQKMGGLIGYYLTVLEMLALQNEKVVPFCYQAPEVYHLDQKKYLFSGIESLAHLGEIYLVGGLGDRLKLMNEKAEPLPAALLPFLGKSLLEILIRDLVGREYLYYKIFHKRLITPLALMTSLEQENERHIRTLLENNQWYGRGVQNYYLFSQILVPVIDSEGHFVFTDSGHCLLHPGGHGAIWKAAEEEGVYEWLTRLSKKAFIIRQINNPVANLDGSLIRLAGCGNVTKKTLGIASCERAPHAAEGILVNKKTVNNGWITVNIEYTDFKKYGIEELSHDKARFSTNTNILYVNLKKIEKVVQENPVPECLLNMKTKIGNKLAGRLECMMQNMTHFLESPSIARLETFVTYNERSKTISTAKRAFDPEKSLLETPEGAFFDLLQENYSLAKRCGFSLPLPQNCTDYLKEGPSLLFLYHPALGPLYEIIEQKMKGGKIGFNSEINLEIAEVYIENLSLQGSLHIEAQDVCGDQGGFCYLKNVSVENAGIKRNQENIYWKNEIERLESCQILLEENAELFAENVTLKGNMIIRVPAHTRLIIHEIQDGLVFEKEEVKKSLSWKYLIEGDKINLSLSHEPSFCEVPI